MADTKKIVEKIYADIQAEMGEIKKITKFDADAFPALIQIVFHTITAVENWGGLLEPLTSDEKKDVAVDVINKFVDIPVAPEWLEAIGIHKMVDMIVTMLNKIFGKNWLEKVSPKK